MNTRRAGHKDIPTFRRTWILMLLCVRLVNWQPLHEEKKTAALAKTYLDDVLGHLDVDAAAADDDDDNDDDDDSNKYYFLLYLRLFFDTSDSNNNNKMMMMKMLVMSLLTHSDCPCLPLTTRRESSQLNPKNTEHDFKPYISKMTN